MMKDSIILTFSKGIRGILMLIFNMMIARVFTEDLYGTYKHINLIVNLLTSVCILGIPTTISYFYSTYNKEKKEKLFGNTMLILLVISIITSSLLIFEKDFVIKILNNIQLFQYINIVAFYVGIMLFSSFLENIYISSDNAKALGIIYISYTVINFIFMVMNCVLFMSLQRMVYGIVIIELIRTIIMLSVIKHKEELKLNFNYGLAKIQIKFAIPLGIVALIQNINGYVDNLFISYNYTPEQYGAFANAAMDIPLVSIVTVSIASVILPKMSKMYKENGNCKKIIRIWNTSCENTAIIMFPIFWIVLFFSLGYIEIIFSSKYVISSTPIFIIYLMKFPLYCTVFGNVLIVFGKQKYIMYNSLCGIILNIILNSLFVKTFGIEGPAISTVLVQYIIVYLQLRQISISSRISITRIMPYNRLIRIFLIPGIFSCIFYFLSSVLGIPNTWSLIIFGPIVYILSILIYIKFNYISKEELLAIVKRK